MLNVHIINKGKTNSTNKPIFIQGKIEIIYKGKQKRLV